MNRMLKPLIMHSNMLNCKVLCCLLLSSLIVIVPFVYKMNLMFLSSFTKQQYSPPTSHAKIGFDSPKLPISSARSALTSMQSFFCVPDLH